MKKSLLLKDLANSPKGYLRSTKEGIVCRVSLDAPANGLLIFTDGTQMYADLAAGNAEQVLTCSEKGLSGGCVFRGETMLLASDETARHAFEKMKKLKKPISEPDAKKDKAAQKAQENERTIKRDAVPLPDRRWPPPPCWETAVYRQGVWQER